MSSILKGLNESYFNRDEQDQQNAMDTRRRSDLSGERNAGLNEPDELPTTPQQSRNGVYEYNVPTGQEKIAQELGLQLHKGHWFSRVPIQKADFQFGRPQFHEIPSKNVSEAESDYGPEYQDKVQRLGQMAKQGERKTVWDPVKRVYKTVPVNPPKEQGVAEGSNDTIYPNAEVIKSRNGRPVGEIYQDENGWGFFHYRMDSGNDFIDSREDAIEGLRDLHQETVRSRPDYTIKGVAEGSEYKSRHAHKQEQDKAYADYRTKHATSSMALMTRAEFAKDQRERAAKKKQGVAEGLSKRDQQDVAAIRAAIARLEAQLNQPNVDRDAIQQSIAHERKRLALYGQGVAEGKEDKIKQLKQDLATAQHWAKNEKSPQKREAARQKAEKIKQHLATQYKQSVAEVSNDTLTSYLTKLDRDNLKHKMDPTKRSDSKRMKSGPNFVKAFTKLDNRKQGVAEGSSTGPTIKGNKIYYADHVVVCDPDVYSPEYMSDMASDLSPDGDAKTHKRELYFMNNDGSWTVKKLRKQGVTEAELDEAKAKRTVEDIFIKGKKVGSITTTTTQSGMIFYTAQVGNSFVAGPDTREEALKHLKRLYRDSQKEQGVAEGSSTMWEVSFDYGPHQSETVKVKARSAQEAVDKVETAAEKKGRSIMVNWARPAEQSVAEGVAETLPMDDAVKVLRQYGADHFKTTSNELHFYKQGRPFSVDLVMNPDATRSVTLRSLNSATRGLKGQGVAEGIVSVGDTVWAKHPIQRYKSVTGKVLHTDDNSTKIQHRDGTTGTYPNTDVSNDYEELNPNPYRKKEQGVAESVDYKSDAEALKKQGNMIGYHKTMVRYYDALANNASHRADVKRYEALANKHHAASKGVAEEKQRLDPSCWDGYKKQGTKMKGDTRVNNCVPKESAIMKGLADGNRRGDK